MVCTEGEARASDDQPPPEKWYGGPGLVLDGVAVTTMTAGFFVQDGGGVLLAGAGLHLVGAPVVHIIHGHPLRALASFGLRVGGNLVGMLVGGYVGVALGHPNPHCEDACYDGLGEAVTGALIGIDVAAIGVSIVDASVLAYDAPHARPAGSLVPYVGSSNGRTAPLAVSLGEASPGGFISPRMAWAVDSSQHRTPVFGVGGRF